MDARALEFERAAKREREFLMRMAVRLAGPVDADDLVQDTLVRAWAGWSGYRGAASFRSWAVRIMRNLHVDETRRRRVPVCSLEAVQTVYDVADPAPTVEVQVIGVLATQDALRSLPRYQQPVFERVLAGYSATEIAEDLAIHPGTVRTRTRRARKALQDRARDG